MRRQTVGGRIGQDRLVDPGHLACHREVGLPIVRRGEDRLDRLVDPLAPLEAMSRKDRAPDRRPARRSQDRVAFDQLLQILDQRRLVHDRTVRCVAAWRCVDGQRLLEVPEHADVVDDRPALLPGATRLARAMVCISVWFFIGLSR